jgi:hypothetical protein
MDSTPKTKGGKKPVLSTKQIVARYQALFKVLQNHSFNSDQKRQAAVFSVKGINNTKNDIRTPAYDCMGELYRMMGGDEISKYYDGLREA